MDRSLRMSSSGRLRGLGALIAAAPILLAMSPSPAPTGPGPIEPPPPASPAPVPTGPLFPPPSIDPLDRPSGAGPGVEPPPDVVGAWYTGNVSVVGYVDPVHGSYGSGGSQGLAYTFRPDGSWQYGYLITSALYGCEMRVLFFRQGVLAASDPAAQVLSLDTQLAQMHSEDSCVLDNDYDRDLPPDDETLIWVRTSDEYGDALLLRGPDTGFSVFRPVQ